ncbi:uncharacterized protein PFL1_01056 [Pseudozyma flocculosa PF-1]|uniref:uncharacterized protein n=1 Tax=Pseudozyma flocculosa PF-1 TaxID=1277687 RepID=UPI0004560CE4|nr:uncharacterized protein PFL1_01056 [Pseudozyma flocculosa PF-1]EPQ31723.1 hypothetical protein PFL1_01056 [Pseudozyma flocculosa PF-1]
MSTMSDSASVKDETTTVTPATSLAETPDSPTTSHDNDNDNDNDNDSRTGSRFRVDDALTADQLDSLYEDLPDDSTALKAIVGTMRLEMSKRDQTITKLQGEIDEVKASHSVILQRSAEWKDELETLRTKVPALESELQQEKEARELEADRVKDLRLRAEESRRAIMRLQGDQGAARAKAKADNRRSMGPGVLANWVPPGSSGGRDDQEDAELKKSKRASMIFGPNAGLSINAAAAAGRPGHRRSASGSRSVSGNSRAGDAADDFDEPLSPTLQQNANGLRGLRLSGASFGPNGSSLHPSAANGDDTASNAGSRRSSYNNGPLRSPRLSGADLPTEADASHASRLAVPSGGSGIRGMLGLSSPAGSSAGFASPILEDGEDADGPARTKKGPASASGDQPSRSNSASDNLHLEADLKAKDVEVERLTREMREMRNKMDEAIEARLASEACLKALREFISTHDAAADASEPGDVANDRSSVGAGLLKGVKLPPLPTDEIEDDAASAPSRRDSKAATGGWSMKLPQLMRKNTLSSTSANSTPAQTPADESTSAASLGSSPKASGAQAAPGATAGGPTASSSIGGSLANLLSRNSVSAGLGSLGSAPAAPSAPTVGSPESQSTEPPAASELVSSPSTTSNAFKGFGWFKKGSQASSAAAAPNAAPQEGATSPAMEFEDKIRLF